LTTLALRNISLDTRHVYLEKLSLDLRARMCGKGRGHQEALSPAQKVVETSLTIVYGTWY